MKKAFSVLLVLAVTAAFAFATGQTESSATQPSTAKQITMRIMWWGSQQRHERTIKVLHMYEQAHPNVKFDYEFATWNDYWTKLTTMAAGNNLPDIMQQDYAYLTQWASRGLVIPLDNYIANKTIDLTNVPDAAVSGGRVEGKMYAIDLGTNSMGILIDAGAFKRAGMAMPPKEWTFQDWSNAAEQIHQKLGIWGFGYNYADVNFWIAMTIGMGKTPFNKAGTELGYPPADDNVLMNYMNMVKKMYKDGVFPPYSDTVTFRNQGVESGAVVTGKAAMTHMWSNQVVAAWTAAGVDKRDLVFYAMPKVTANGPSSNYVKNGQFFSITKNSQNPEEAAKFISYFTNDIDANKVLLAERGVPVSTVVLNALKPLLDKPNQEVFAYMAYISPIASPTPPPEPKGASTLEQQLYDTQVFDPFMFDKISAEQAVQTWRTIAKQTLQGY
ncbi:MAG TPA: extracellular solute-binding protein [Spirochaetia bacterium]|nr:extracellular solute-binding protein [Spirochaetia bacterium]